MATYALGLCLFLIAVLLVRDGNRRHSVSAALWIPTAMVFVLASRTPSLWLGSQPDLYTGLSNNASGNLIDQAFFLGSILAAWIIATSRGVQWQKLFATNKMIMAFYGYFVLSALWSAYPFESLTRIMKDFGITIVVISAILSEKDPLEAVRAVYARCACVLFPLSVLFFRYNFASFGRTYAKNGDPEYIGVATQKNSLGEMVLILGLFLIWDQLEEGFSGIWDRLLLLLMGGYVLHLSSSKTSLVCLLIGAALILRNKTLSSRVISGIVFYAAMCLPFIVWSSQEFASTLSPMLGALGRDITFTGRTSIWQQITSTTVNPIIGAGYWNFWGGEGGRAISEALRTFTPNVHNGYLDIYIDGGWIGVILLFLLLVIGGEKLSAKAYESRFYRVRFAALIVAIIVNLTESYFARPSLVWFTTLLALVQFPSPDTGAGETFKPVPKKQSEPREVMHVAS